jgi:double-stranded uracil-DNA glycosylase
MTRRQPLPDVAAPKLDVLFVGINPGLRSAELGHHFAGASNRFWKLLFESGLVAERLGFEDDIRLPELGLGLTNIVDRPSRSVSDLSPDDFRIGRERLRRKIVELEPAITALVGVTVYRALFQVKDAVTCGLTEHTIGLSRVFVLPNPSGRNAHFSHARMLEVYRELAMLRPRNASDNPRAQPRGHRARRAVRTQDRR